MVTEDAAPALAVVGLREMSSANIPIRVKKRDGSVVSFDESRIRNAIRGAAYEVLQDAEQADPGKIPAIAAQDEPGRTGDEVDGVF